MSGYNIGIRGVVESTVSHDEFLSMFIEWVEANNFRFCGSSREIDDDGDNLSELKFTDVI